MFPLDIFDRKSMLISISEIFDLLSVDPDKPQHDDDEGDWGGDGPKYPELRGYNKTSGSV